MDTLTELKNLIDELNLEYQDLEKALAKYQEDESIAENLNLKDGSEIKNAIAQVQDDIQILENTLKDYINSRVDQRNKLRERQL